MRSPGAETTAIQLPFATGPFNPAAVEVAKGNSWPLPHPILGDSRKGEWHDAAQSLKGCGDGEFTSRRYGRRDRGIVHPLTERNKRPSPPPSVSSSLAAAIKSNGSLDTKIFMGLE